MSSDFPSEDSEPSDSTMAFLIKILTEHEQNLDKMIDKLAGYVPQTEKAKELCRRFEKLEVGLGNLERDIKLIMSYFSVAPK